MIRVIELDSFNISSCPLLYPKVQFLLYNQLQPYSIVFSITSITKAYHHQSFIHQSRKRGVYSQVKAHGESSMSPNALSFSFSRDVLYARHASILIFSSEPISTLHKQPTEPAERCSYPMFTVIHR